MTKYVFIGDVHGKVEAVEKALALDGHKIFVGDFQDSFDRSIKDHEQCYRLVLEGITKGEASAIYGNHELSYLNPIHRCSGYTYERHKMISQFRPEIEELFCHWILLGEDTLVTHAGLTKQIWDDFNLTKDNMLDFLAEGVVDNKHPCHWIGWSRGGRDAVGGIYWCDFNKEFQPIPELRQIFGHTAGKDIRRVEDSFCIDCLNSTGNTFLELEIED